jgi:hypothetical protein
MKSFLQNKLRRATALAAAALVLALVLGASPAQAGRCEQALTACLIQNGLTMLVGLISTGGLASVLAAQYCLAGYSFCCTYLR